MDIIQEAKEVIATQETDFNVCLGGATTSNVQDLISRLVDSLEWKPIESAPKDGTVIIVYRPLAEKSQDPKITLKRGVNYNNHCWDGTVPEGKEKINYTDGACYPTHWMPLPLPPVGDK